MNISDKLRVLKEKGKMFLTKDFMIYYSPFMDTFYLDIPEGKKLVSFFSLNKACLGERFTYDLSGMYPYAVEVGDKTYEQIWTEFEPYLNGASVNLIPTDYKSGYDEYMGHNRRR